MHRRKDKRKILHNPSTHEIFACLSHSLSYSRILVTDDPQKPYSTFLEWLLTKDFFASENEKITVKRMATGFKSDSGRITKWIHQIYEEIFELNFDKPALFQNSGTPVTLYMQSYDNSGKFDLSVKSIPREFETIRFPFMKAKMGTDLFWVKKVEHIISDDRVDIEIWLEGGFLNKYREFVLDKALFQGHIGFMEVFDKHSFELDDELKRLYKH